MRRLTSFIFLRVLFWTVLVGGLTGFLATLVSPTKKGKSTDVVLGIVGAFLGCLFLIFLKGDDIPRSGGFLVFQIIGALVLILIGRVTTSEGK